MCQLLCSVITDRNCSENMQYLATILDGMYRSLNFTDEVLRNNGMSL